MKDKEKKGSNGWLWVIAVVILLIAIGGTGKKAADEPSRVLDRIQERRDERQADRAKRRLFVPFSRWWKDKWS